MEPVAFHTELLETSVGHRGALVVTPRVHVRVHATRLNELRTLTSVSPIDDLILRRALDARGKVQACVFRGGSDDGVGSYGLADDLAADTARELATELMRAQLKVYRALVGAGVCIFIHVEFRDGELDAYRDATEDLVRERAACLADPAASEYEQQLARLDTWLLRNLVFFFHIDCTALLERVLPEKFSLLEKRMGRAKELALRLAELQREQV